MADKKHLPMYDVGPLFFFYWILMTVLMKCTEEKWLKKRYGMEYEEYLRRVNRCIPWRRSILQSMEAGWTWQR